jgi:hypothetical protein
MNDRAKESIRIMVLVIMSLWISHIAYGQTQSPQFEQLPESPAQGPRPKIRRVGVVAAQFEPDVRFDKPMTKGKALLHGAKEGGLGTIAVGFILGSGQSAFAGLILSPVGAVVGSAVGVIKGSTAREIKESEDVLQGYVETLNLQEMMYEQLMSAVGEQAQYPFVRLDVEGPKMPSEEVVYDLSSFEDIDAVLEVGVRECRLDGKPEGINPDLQLVIRADTRFLVATDGQLRDRYFFHFSNDLKKFALWSADNARLFQKELNLGLQSLARQIMETFISYVNYYGTQEPEEDSAAAGQQITTDSSSQDTQPED